MPAIISGLDSLHLRLIYPTEAIKHKIEGKVYVLVTIDSLGNPFCAKIIKGIGYGCDEEALRLVNSSKYTAGEQRGKPIVITMSIPIVFKIDDNF
ncbi:MAG: energy transducer TonB [Bacteroidetes bacterium]|nr:energy transducer TonB [Bacteroidota bacterium]